MKMKENLIRSFCTLAVIGFIVLLLFVIPNSQSKTQEKEEKYMTGIHHVLLTVKDLGEITIELDADTAPITVTNFLKLVNSKFYDGLTFHRIIDGFMIQGGDPTGTGSGGSKETITGEFASNGIKNDITHVRGVISMARSNDKNSASSQFFIVHKDSEYLDGNYAGFGHVTKGIEVVDKVVKSVKGKTGSNGEVDPEDQPVIESIVQID